MPTKYIHDVKGDATKPLLDGKCIIAHVVNDAGRFGAGFTAALVQRFQRIPRKSYHDWCDKGEAHGVPFRLGETLFVNLNDEGLMLAHMLAQHGVGTSVTRVQYDPLKVCLERVFEVAKEHDYSVHMPRIGSGLGGGDWKTIRALIATAHKKKGPHVETFIYKLEK